MVTKVFSISDNINQIIAQCISILKMGGLVAFPTETVYGLGAMAFDLTGVNKIYEVKGRPKDNPLIYHVSSIDWIEKLAKLSEKEYKIIEKFFPGPLTLVLNSKIDKSFTFNLNTIAIRMPDNLIALKLIKECGSPIVAPSANLSGRPSPTKVEHVIEDFLGKIDAIIDGGETVYGIESTVIDATSYPYRLLRLGATPIEDIRECGFEIQAVDSSELLKRSPGTRYRHYAPRGKLIIIEKIEDLKKHKEVMEYKRCGYMGISVFEGITICQKEIFRDDREYSRYLYATLRYFDALNIEVIFAEALPEVGLGRAINDRLRRARGEEPNL